MKNVIVAETNGAYVTNRYYRGANGMDSLLFIRF